MKPKQLDEITDSRMILGLLREILFTEVAVQSVSSSGVSQPLRLMELQESSTRKLGEKRTLLFESAQDRSCKLSLGETLELQIGFGRFRLEAKVEILNLTLQQLSTSLPERVFLRNKRTMNRAPVGHELRTPTPVMIRTQGLYCEAMLILEDLSEKGFGGLLHLDHDFPLMQSSEIAGTLAAAQGAVSIHGDIVRALRLPSSKTSEIKYKIGIRQKSKLSPSPSPSPSPNKRLEQRKKPRFRTEDQIILSPLLRPEKSIPWVIDDASLIGFAAKLRDPLAQLHFPVGTQFSRDSGSLIFELVAFEGPLFRFQLVAGNENDRLTWLRSLSPWIQQHTALSASDAREILQIFCQAGALSTPYLKSHQRFSKPILDELEADEKENLWVHRWIGRAPSGRVTAHISSLRVADNTWIVGDLVGSQDPTEKMAPEFLSTFFLTFRDFSNTLTPCPRHLLMWITGHPYWAAFEKFIENHQAKIVTEFSNMGYTRLDQLPPSSFSAPEVKRLEPSDYLSHAKLKELLQKRGIAATAASLDLDTDRFESPALKQIFNQSKQRFFRHYYEVRQGSLHAIVVISGFPLGGSLNRIPESAWIFQLTEVNPSQEDWTQVVLWIQTEGLRLGLKIPSLRRIYGGSPILLNSETATLRCFLCHPNVWSFFEPAQEQNP